MVIEAGVFWREIFHCAGHRWWPVAVRRQYRTKRRGGHFISQSLQLFVEERGLLLRGSPSLLG